MREVDRAQDTEDHRHANGDDGVDRAETMPLTICSKIADTIWLLPLVFS